MIPYFKKISSNNETPPSLYAKLAMQHKYAFLLESAEKNLKIGRYSFIGFDPLFLHIFPANSNKNPLEILKKTYTGIKYKPNSALPNLQAGFVGYFSYEVARHFEKIDLLREPSEAGRARSTKKEIPKGIFFLPKNLIVFNHFENSLTLITYTKKDLAKLTELIKKNKKNPDNQPADKKHAKSLSINNISALISQKNAQPNNFKASVLQAKKSICAGETFQIVLSQLFKTKTQKTPFEIYKKMRLVAPSPYMYLLKYPDFSIIGSSPETLIKTEQNEIFLRPIAGTRARGKDKKEDTANAKELMNDKKEQAEHMMLVDLGRNDVGKVAIPGSVRITKLMQVEKFSHVMHLVSEIRGKRTQNASLFDIFPAAFPAGTLTGAPKIRAMEIIARLEKEPRGIYGGAVGYFDLSGNMDFAIAIRTILYKNNEIYLRAGAGIVYDSKPYNEHKECCNKARGILTAALQ